MSADLLWASILTLLLVGNNSQVLVVHADAVATDMIQFHAFGDTTDKHSPRGTVRANDFITESDLAVPVLIDGTSPVPAPRIPVELEFGNEALKQCFKFTWHNKKAADSHSLIRPHSMATSLNRLLKFMFFTVQADQCLLRLWQRLAYTASTFMDWSCSMPRPPWIVLPHGGQT